MIILIIHFQYITNKYPPELFLHSISRFLTKYQIPFLFTKSFIYRQFYTQGKRFTVFHGMHESEFATILLIITSSKPWKKSTCQQYMERRRSLQKDYFLFFVCSKLTFSFSTHRSFERLKCPLLFRSLGHWFKIIWHKSSHNPE